MKKIFTILFSLFLSLSAVVAQTAPDFNFTDTKGNEHNLQNALDQGYLVIIDFFFFDCPPCQATAPWVSDLMESLEGKNVLLWSFSDRDSDELIDEFDENFDLRNYGSGPEGGGDAVIDLYADNFNFIGFPTFSVVCTDGSITWDIWPLTEGAPEIEAVLNGCGVEDAAAPYEPLIVNSIANIEYLNDLRIFPNPVEDMANVSILLDRSADIDVNIFDVLGRPVQSVFSGKMSEGTNQISLDASQLISGNYFVKMTIDEEVVIRNLVKQ